MLNSLVNDFTVTWMKYVRVSSSFFHFSQSDKNGVEISPEWIVYQLTHLSFYRAIAHRWRSCRRYLLIQNVYSFCTPQPNHKCFKLEKLTYKCSLFARITNAKIKMSVHYLSDDTQAELPPNSWNSRTLHWSHDKIEAR